MTSSKGLQVVKCLSQPALCIAARGGSAQSWCEIETVAAFCVLIRVVHDVAAGFLFFFVS